MTLAEISDKNNTAVSKLVLGTAQFGMLYGLGQAGVKMMPQTTVFKILDKAWEMGIRTLDTAPEYGLAHHRIAEFFRSRKNKDFKIISKVKSFPLSTSKISFTDWFYNTYTNTLNVQTPIILLLHNQDDVKVPDKYERLNDLTKKGLIDGWGASIYSEDAALDCIKNRSCSTIQLPFGPLNQGFNKAKLFAKFHQSGKIVQARSIFTQGLIFRNSDNFSRENFNLTLALQKIDEICGSLGQTRMQFAVNLVSEHEAINQIIVGVDKLDQLDELIVNNFAKAPPNELLKLGQIISKIPNKLVRPELWRTK